MENRRAGCGCVLPLVIWGICTLMGQPGIGLALGIITFLFASY